MMQYGRRRSIRTDVNTERHTDGRILSVRPVPLGGGGGQIRHVSSFVYPLCLSSATLQPRFVVHLVASLATRWELDM